MEGERADAPAPHELGGELRAAVEARRELGPEMSDYVMEAFLARLQGQIDLRIAEGLERAGDGRKEPSRISRSYNPVPIVAISFGVAIPLSAIAGKWAGGPGLVAVMVVVLLVNLLYVLSNRP